AIQTTLKSKAAEILVKYLNQDFPNFITTKYDPANPSAFMIDWSPEVNLLGGGNDAFNGLVVKLTGNALLVPTTTVGGIVTPDTREVINVFPISLGLETNQELDKINSLLEIGYVPWYKNKIGANSPFYHTRIGVFLQLGYKSHIASDSLEQDSSLETGGKIDE